MRFYRQKDKNSCGPVAIKNACKTINKEYSLTYLRRLCKVTRNNGTTIRNLLNASKKCGLRLKKARNFYKTKQYIIAYASSQNTGHFVFVYKRNIINFNTINTVVKLTKKRTKKLTQINRKSSHYFKIPRIYEIFQ